MTYEKQLEEKIEKITIDIESYQEVVDDLADTLKESCGDLKLFRNRLNEAIDVFNDLITENRTGVGDTEYNAYGNLQGCGAIVSHIIELIENKLDEYGLYNDQ